MVIPCQPRMLTIRRIGRHAVDLWQEVSGAAALEYGLIAALIAVPIIGLLIELRAAWLGLRWQSLFDAFASVLS